MELINCGNVELEVEMEGSALGLKNGPKSRKFLQLSVQISVLPGPKCRTENGQGF